MLEMLTKRKTSLQWALVALALLAFIGLGWQRAFQQVGVLAWKLLLVGVATIVAHGARRQLFHYCDMSKMIAEGNPLAGWIFLGLCVFYAAIITAICSGL